MMRALRLNRIPALNEHIKKLLITSIAIIGYGGWALYSNWPADGGSVGNVVSSVGNVVSSEAQMIAIRAGIIQGSYSGLLTLVNIIILEAVFLKLNSRLPCNVNMAATVSIATITQYAIIIPIHIMNQTPNIFITLLPGFIIGTAFSTAYLMSVRYKHYPPKQATLKQGSAKQEPPANG